MKKAAIGIVGLGVMGQSLALNMERNGFPVVGLDLDKEKVEKFLSDKASGKQVFVVDTPQALMDALEKPRRILLMVPAGKPVDDAINGLKGFMEAGDILIDGGNSFFLDTERRSKALAEEGLNFVGMGVSGGEEGALWGPSMMPGGQEAAWTALRPILEAMAAKAADGQPCVTHIGPRGAGHYVKMVHNGIEYADMQLIAEIYDLLHRGLGMSNSELHQLFSEWNQGMLQSYLVEITADIFEKKDPESGQALVDLILDEAQQKGTGKWTSQNALDIGAPIPTINAAVESRILSGLKAERVAASKVISGPSPRYSGSEREKLIAAAQDALLASKITSYAQGLGLLRIASQEYDYQLNMKEIAKIWRAGCIIRARLLGDIMDAYERNPKLVNLLLDDNFRTTVERKQDAWRLVLTTGIELGIPMLATASALAYFDAYRSERLPANLTQAQRDYFGAHTYRRVDREGSFHTEWVK
ncbi:MAG: phosphogluconate dehydrogenase (NADP(+)-dependent, decarboxylating) [Chloroflexi bacterium HGW-Chloroflexi-10]|nr:MAG: phosphogluconate dehydrogenase (NADP(+)-dependent, decarboxylating) [Chloroflexi bacterium HGW-Chloroflexi-10]